jgi:hypothetical protein
MTTIRACPIERWTHFDGTNVQEIKNEVKSGSGFDADRWEWSLTNGTLTIDTLDYAGVVTVNTGDWVSGMTLSVRSSSDFQSGYFQVDGS